MERLVGGQAGEAMVGDEEREWARTETTGSGGTEEGVGRVRAKVGWEEQMGVRTDKMREGACRSATRTPPAPPPPFL